MLSLFTYVIARKIENAIIKKSTIFWIKLPYIIATSGFITASFSKIAGLKTIPAIIKIYTEKQIKEVSLIENLQREDLNPIDEAMGYQKLISDFGITQEEAADRVGKSRSAVTNALRLLKLPLSVIEKLRDGSISAGHARALLSCEDEELRQKMLIAAAEGASVRELEAMAKAAKPTDKKAKVSKPGFYTEVELALKNELGRVVKIAPKGKGKGTITLEFYSDAELKDFAKRLTD